MKNSDLKKYTNLNVNRNNNRHGNEDIEYDDWYDDEEEEIDSRNKMKVKKFKDSRAR